MLWIRARGADTLRVEELRLFERVFGLPFLCSGLFLLWIVAWALPFRLTTPSEPAARSAGDILLLLAVFVVVCGGCVVFLFAGAMLTLYREAVTVDRASGLVTYAHGWIVLFRRKTHRLDAITEIAVFNEVRKGAKGGRHMVFPVRLALGNGGKEFVDVWEAYAYAKADRLARRLADWTGLPVADRTWAKK